MVIMSVLFLLIMLCAGPLLPTWMFINSMSLIFHVPLIKSDMPAHTFVFMIEYLEKLRIHFDWSNEIAKEWLGSPARFDAEVIDENSFYSIQIK